MRTQFILNFLILTASNISQSHSEINSYFAFFMVNPNLRNSQKIISHQHYIQIIVLKIGQSHK